MAQPCKRSFPISEDALSDCARRSRVSSVSGGNTNSGDSDLMDSSVGGVEAREGGDCIDVADVEVERTESAYMRIRRKDFDKRTGWTSIAIGAE